MPGPLRLTIPTQQVDLDGTILTMRMMPAETLERYIELRKAAWTAGSAASQNTTPETVNAYRQACVDMLLQILPDADGQFLHKLITDHPYAVDEVQRIQREFQQEAAPLGNLLSLLSRTANAVPTSPPPEA